MDVSEVRVEQPSLRQAKWRTTVATERFKAFAAEDRKVREHKATLRVTYDPDDYARGNYQPYVDFSELKPATYDVFTAQAMVSETLHHLRCALDHVAYNLAWLDSGRPREMTAFPISPTVTRWRNRVDRDLPGVKAPNVERVKAFQPFMGCAWSGTLAEFSNFDKHRMLVEVSRSHSAIFKPSDAYLDPATGKMIQPTTEVEGYLALPDDSEATPALRELLIGVTQCVFSFQELFGETDRLSIG